MKKIQLKKYIIPALHILFWFVSFNFWNFILNPGVESASIFEGYEVEWELVVLINSLFLLTCSLPFIWLHKKARLWLKIVISILFVSLVIYLIGKELKSEGNEDVDIFIRYFIKNFLYVVVFHLTVIGAVYFNLKVLLARYLNNSKFAPYLLYSAGLTVLSAILNYSLFNFCIDKVFPSLYYISYFKIWELILIVTAYLIFTSVLYLIWEYAQMLVAKRETAQNELSALKAQINPHFLFNNLNTIYSMASQNDRRTSDVILKLSDFLRYVLYDTSSERIPLSKEVDMIKTYVGLQKERINPEITTIDLETSGDFSMLEIAPLLLLPLAENCFKHGIGKDPGTIRISIKMEDKALVFTTENNIAKRESSSNKESHGIGIQNVEKRLALIYPELNSLEYGQDNGIYKLELKINLKG